MKKNVLVLLVVFLSILTVNAQNYVGVQVGYTQPITRLNAPEIGQEKVLNPIVHNGFKLGVVYDATIIKGLGVTMGLNYTFGANKTDWEKLNPSQPGDLPKLCSSAQYHQLEIPVDWQYKFEIAKRTWLIVYTGPTLQCGLQFKKNITEDYGNKQNQRGQNLFSESDMKDKALKRLNVTWGLGAGFQYERYFLRGGYDFGIINPYKSYQFNKVIGEGNPRTRGRFDQWQIKIGMYFWEFK